MGAPLLCYLSRWYDSGFLEDKCVCKGKEAIGAAKQIQSTNVCKWDIEQCYLIEKDKMLAMPGKSKR